MIQVRRSTPLGSDERRCAQCWLVKPVDDFVGARGGVVQRCADCREKYWNWNSKTAEEKAAVERRGVPVLPDLRVRLALRSGNRKLGGIPASITSRVTCPPSCSFYNAGCYAEYHVMGHHWRNVGERGDPWDTFLADVRGLPPGQLWRHNVAGDLPGDGEVVDRRLLAQLVAANRGKRGFTFTHKHRSATNRAAVRAANRGGFTVNLSADNLCEADALARTGAGPVVVVLPHDAPDSGVRTPAGRRVVVCPAERDLLTCAECRLCAHSFRKAIVGFRAHGQSKYRVDDIVQLRRKEASA